MSTEQEPLLLDSGSEAVDDCNVSRVEVGMSELPADPLSGCQDLGLGTQNVTKESEKKEVSVHCADVIKESVIQTELLVDKEVFSHGANGSDDECFMGLEPHESKDECALDNENVSVTLKAKLSDSDLVWAKVRSHPWWPGQVFDASAATDKAKKYFKKGSFLVTYFGDCSFAWNDASKIKPFRQHFPQMAKQSSLPDFLDAVDFALEEVSRRIEFGLACSCISREVYERIKTQNIVNPGIREEASRIQGGDKVSSAVFFEPADLVEYVKRLACSPPSYDASDELQFVSQRAKLLAFNRWKGYTELPEFETLEGSVESAIKISEVKESAPEPKKSKQVYSKRTKTEDKEDHSKLDGVFEYVDTTVPKKKEKTLAEFIAEIRLSKRKGKRSHENLIQDHCKVVHSKLPKSAKKTKTNNLHTEEDSGSPILSPKNDQKITPKKAKTSFGIGASILRVANQMHCSTTPSTVLVPCSKNNDSGKREPSSNETLSSSHHSATRKQNGEDNLQSGEVEHVLKERPSTTTKLVEEDSKLKGPSEEQMVNEAAGNIASEMNVVDSNLNEEKITGSTRTALMDEDSSAG